jgi:hypothetical protein
LSKFTWIVIIWLSCFLGHIKGKGVHIGVRNNLFTSLLLQMLVEMVDSSNYEVCTVEVLLNLNLYKHSLALLSLSLSVLTSMYS